MQESSLTQGGNLYILAAPRTGSTVFYLVLAKHLFHAYIPNHLGPHAVRHFANFVVQHRTKIRAKQFESWNQFGKTRAPFAPSEGSLVFRYFFGGGHPSELVSKSLITSRKKVWCENLQLLRETGISLITKNAWNAFRISALAEADPLAHFLWLRRDIFAAAKSDYAAKVERGSSTRWNSASPADWHRIRALPPWQQSLEQQHGFTVAIREGLAKLSPSRHTSVWWEDLLLQTEKGATSDLWNLCGSQADLVRASFKEWLIDRASPRADKLSGFDDGRVEEFIESNQRFVGLRYQR